MIRHIVMWNLHEQAEGADKATNLVKAKALLLSCAQVVPGICAFEVATATPGPMASTFPISWVMPETGGAAQASPEACVGSTDRNWPVAPAGIRTF